MIKWKSPRHFAAPKAKCTQPTVAKSKRAPNGSWLNDIFWQDGKADESIIGRPASELLQKQDYRLDSPYFRYVLDGQPRSQQFGTVLVEQIKDVSDRPYLPGSSIKGALRTVLAWHGFQAQGMALDVEAVRGGPKWAGQAIERQIFGKDPNHDLLRALHIADTQPVPADRLQIVNAQVFAGREKSGAPIELEAIRSDTVFSTTFTLDKSLHAAEAEQELRFGRRWEWLVGLPAIARAHALSRVDLERKWSIDRKYDALSGFYTQLFKILQENRLADHQFLLQIGWGGGWQSKTIGAPLQSDPAAWERLLANRRLSPARMDRRRGDPFPKSRRAVAANAKPAAPFGWCLVEMEAKKP